MRAVRVSLWVALTAVTLVAACGSGRSGGSAAKSATDDILRLFPRRPLSQVADGSVEPLEQVLARNREVVDNAFSVRAFEEAVQQADSHAAPVVQSKTTEWFEHLGETLERRAELKLRQMICEARLYAANETGDVSVLEEWVLEEFGGIGIELSQSGLYEVSSWLADQVNDKTSTYTLACMAWARTAVR